MSIKEMVDQGKKVTFQFYRKGELWYVTKTGFAFPVPISDTGDAEFLAQDKAILFMRWIKRHWDAVTTARKEIVTQPASSDATAWSHPRVPRA